MAHPGQELSGPDGTRLRLVRVEEDVLEMEAHYPGSGALPPEHLHPRQAERFEVLAGELRTIIDGAERTYAAGEVFDVPAGTPHQMAADTPTRFTWQVRPALRTAEFFEGLYSGAAAKDPVAFLASFAEEFRLT
jgi:quercetin dioxygenase-like cupin family protein